MIERLLRWMLGMWRSHQHRLDVAILWPELWRQTEGNRSIAEAVFRKHMELDPSYDHMDEAERQAFLDRLPPAGRRKMGQED